MTSRDFCYWLQGFFEVGRAPDEPISAHQAETIRKHLALVFVHEIDPSAGPPEHQAELDAIHASPAVAPKPPATIGGTGPGGILYRC